MARSLLPVLLLIIVGATTGFFEAAVPHQEAATASPAKAFTFGAAATATSVFDDGLDNPNVVSDMSIHPARKCGFCMGVSVLYFYPYYLTWILRCLITIFS